MPSSPPSKPARLRKPAKPSTTSWKTPEPGDVIHYAYLWEHEARQGLEEGLKDRPCAVVLAVTTEDRQTVVSVCPVTSQPQEETGRFVTLPPAAKAHLGLTDRGESHVVTTEINRFIWPGPDLRLLEGNGQSTVYHGQLPAKLLRKIQDSLIANIRTLRLKTTPRS